MLLENANLSPTQIRNFGQRQKKRQNANNVKDSQLAISAKLKNILIRLRAEVSKQDINRTCGISRSYVSAECRNTNFDAQPNNKQSTILL